jgi:von Willebrand factor type A domain/Aerotolerance regulator N-terminal
MYLLNLSLFQVLAVFGSISAISVALYLLDRSRRKQVVSTLRFWVAAENPVPASRRKHIQQPWSLLLQLLGMGLLLLALAQLRFGSPDQAGRDHVVILETSAWMGARSGNRTLMDLARERARRYVRALPSRDRVMLVRADALATPVTSFEPGRAKIEEAIRQSQPGSTALNLDEALSFARHIQSQQGRRAGEIAFIGSGRTVDSDPASTPASRNLRAILIPDAIENCGLRKIGLRRSATDPDLWEIYISAHNYGSKAKTVAISLNFGTQDPSTRVPGGSQQVTIAPGSETETAFQYRTASAGILGVYLTPHDAFPADDHADLELPARPSLTVTVYSNQPELLKPLLASTPRVTAIYRKPGEYRPNDGGLVILDRFIPPQRPVSDSIWIDPPATGSPIPVRAQVSDVAFGGWDSSQSAAAGLRTKDFKLEHASVFEAAPGDGRIGSVESGPVIVARDGKPKVVVLGFHPALSAMRYELATPLLFANLLRWMSPELFQRLEISGASVGSVKLAMEAAGPGKQAANVKVTAEDGKALPFTVHDNAIDFFAGAPGAVRVAAGDREYMYSLTLPELSDSKWKPPANALKGIPAFAPIAAAARDVWPLLALSGALCLLVEWLLYGRFRRSLRLVHLSPALFRRKAASMQGGGRR